MILHIHPFMSRIAATFVVLLALIFVPSESKAFKLSQEAEISIITCAPGNNPATVYGHSAIRVYDPIYNYDLAFNYGIYDFEAPNFVYRFVKGETDYLLAAYKFEAFVNSYKREKRSVYEQVLNLTPKEKQKIVDFLTWNAKPENRVYRYNYFFDNCATRIRDVVVNNVEGGVSFNEAEHSHKTLRQLVEDYHGKILWLTFGIDLIVSSEADREATFWEEMLLPDYVMKHFAGAAKTVSSAPLIKRTVSVYKAPESEFKSNYFLSPFVVLTVLLLLVVYFSFRQFRSGKMKPGLDYFVFGLTGLMGFVMAFLAMFSEHPAMSPNYNLLWAVPFNFLFVFAWMVKSWRSVLHYYFIAMAVCLPLFVVVSESLPQKFHPAFYLLALLVWVRAVFYTLLPFRNHG